MKTKNNFKMGSRMARSYSLSLRSILCSAIIVTGIQTISLAQVPEEKAPVEAPAIPQYTKPNWWFGAAAGANFNFYRGTTQQLNSSLTVPTAFRHGNGIGLYLAPLVEYHKPDSRFGLMFQAGYDGRQGKFDQAISPCNCKQNLSTGLSYITIEPSLRFAPFKSNLYLFAGPRLAFNMSKSFTYKQGTNPLYAEQIANPDVKGDFSSVNQMLISMQIGAGYDIWLSSENRKTQTVLSPFVSFQPYFGQSPRSVETWTVTTLRAGAAIKFGRGKLIPEPAKEEIIVAVPVPDVQFTVSSPENIPVKRRVRETFPLRNYVFFDIGSSEIPDRYVLLTKGQVKDFKEDQLEVFKPKNLAGRSEREMIVYYNILNILGDRMGKNPSATITLVGSSPDKGVADGKAMAQSVKNYLVSVFGIDASRISIEGRKQPKIPSEKPGAKLELKLLREGDRRVSIESSSPALLMEFQSGPDAPLKPVEFVAVQEAPLDSYITFKNAGAKDAFSSWSLEVRDEQGKLQYYGPYFDDQVSIPGKSILGSRPSGTYKVTMVGQAKNGITVKKEASVNMVLWTPPENEEGMRFSVIFEFNKSKAIYMYEKYLTEIVAPKVPKDGTVVVHGYTDIIGDATNNLELSLARANEVKSIIEKALTDKGRSDVKYEVYGFGEDENLSPFANKYPEERFYNRTVVIDIIPHK
jgi:outer membrane protein OmpA-like peptidoglycan-associated protein